MAMQITVYPTTTQDIVLIIMKTVKTPAVHDFTKVRKAWKYNLPIKDAILCQTQNARSFHSFVTLWFHA